MHMLSSMYLCAALRLCCIRVLIVLHDCDLNLTAHLTLSEAWWCQRQQKQHTHANSSSSVVIITVIDIDMYLLGTSVLNTPTQICMHAGHMPARGQILRKHSAAETSI
jgi:hypothetical protein